MFGPADRPQRIVQRPAAGGPWCWYSVAPFSTKRCVACEPVERRASRHGLGHRPRGRGRALYGGRRVLRLEGDPGRPCRHHREPRAGAAGTIWTTHRALGILLAAFDRGTVLRRLRQGVWFRMLCHTGDVLHADARSNVAPLGASASPRDVTGASGVRRCAPHARGRQGERPWPVRPPCCPPAAARADHV